MIHKSLFLIICFFTLIISLSGCKNNSNDYQNFADFKLINEILIDTNSILYEYTNENDIMKLKITNNIERSAALILIENEILAMESMYAGANSPYPGVISNEIKCDESFIPLIKGTKYNDMDITYLIAFFSSRQNLGVCNDDSVAYKGIVSFAYCENKNQLRQMQYISDKESSEKSSLGFIVENICN